MTETTKQQIDTFYKILASIATGGAILGSIATTYWAAKDTSAATRTLVQDTTLLVRENAASNQAALTSFVANTEKHLFILHDKVANHQADNLRLREDMKVIDGKVYEIVRGKAVEPARKP